MFHIMKKDTEAEESWVRLLEDKALEKTNVKVDWDKYVDSDEEEEGFDTSTMGGGMVRHLLHHTACSSSLIYCCSFNNCRTSQA